MRVLFVENDPNLTLLWRAVFENRGAEVLQAERADAAAPGLEGSTFDLVVLDLYVGEAEIFAFAEKIKDANPGCGIVIVAGSDGPKRDVIVDKCPALATILHKPVDIEDVVALCDAMKSSKIPDQSQQRV